MDSQLRASPYGNDGGGYWFAKMLLVDSFKWIPNYGLRPMGMTMMVIGLRECCWLIRLNELPTTGFALWE